MFWLLLMLLFQEYADFQYRRRHRQSRRGDMFSLRSNTPEPEDPSDSTLGTKHLCTFSLLKMIEKGQFNHISVLFCSCLLIVYQIQALSFAMDEVPALNFLQFGPLFRFKLLYS